MSGKYKCRRLEGKVAIVTAATAGIGLAIAERLGHEGAAVVISSRKEANVKQAVEELKRSGAEKVEGIVCHVGNAEHRERLVKFTLEKFGKIDILVNNAGINPDFGDILDVTETVWDKLFDINVKANFLLSKLVVPHMEKNGGGNIIFNSSYSAYKSPPGIAAYGVTKTTVVALVKALANSCAPRNIRVNGIAPGVIKTKMSEVLWSGSSDAEAQITADSAMGRIGSPEECAGAVAFLASDDASYITGETMLIAGGVQARL
ncbi:hypothetical protein QR680_013820 [Steinernema hermaphroditum]|uniref:Dehydrogenase/reductase SDR family member 4 n=1 Tax=Steinernema hermaphroditum TaxID=289476 RepID=A0AA39I8W0_9BILA|nr:hypothetical protein QR680_013820 [Steinernema hermaphroditum]